eukprot:3481940-Pleurochrysis_carterae.AAC.8
MRVAVARVRAIAAFWQAGWSMRNSLVQAMVLSTTALLYVWSAAMLLRGYCIRDRNPYVVERCETEISILTQRDETIFRPPRAHNMVMMVVVISSTTLPCYFAMNNILLTCSSYNKKQAQENYTSGKRENRLRFIMIHIPVRIDM